MLPLIGSSLCSVVGGIMTVDWRLSTWFGKMQAVYATERKKLQLFGIKEKFGFLCLINPFSMNDMCID